MISSFDILSDGYRPNSAQDPRSSFIRATSSSPEIFPRTKLQSSMQSDPMNSTPGDSQIWEVDVFERNPNDDSDFKINFQGTNQVLEDSEKLPAELISLSDNFIDALSAKVHSSPPSVENLSRFFQDFYEIAVEQINTHIINLSPLESRQRSSATTSSLTSTSNKLRTRNASSDNLNRSKSGAENEHLDQQMLTTEEIVIRREARRMLEQKRIAMEEAIERRICEATYDRIWRYRSTHDEERDEKLRSRTASLSLVGIGLKDLGFDLCVKGNKDLENDQEKEREVTEWLLEARKELFAMNDLKYPLGKLQHLKTAHKAIVDTLSHFHPSSSADEIMPMLIYTLITCGPEGINIMSNLHFIQRFRNESKINGEAAYCLTNLEAAISFLETVDLASLRADEVLSGPPKSASRTNTPSPEIFDPLINPLTPSSISALESSCASPNPVGIKEKYPVMGVKQDSQIHNRRFNDLFQPPTSLGAASDAVMSTADQGLETIGNSLGDSYKFFLGKLKGKHDDELGTRDESHTIKVSEDVRKSVETTQEEDLCSSSQTTGVTQRIRSDSGSRIDDRILNIIVGRKTTFDKSSDSKKRVSFAEENSTGKNPSTLPNLSSANPALVESMRNLGNTLNPMNRIAGIGMRAFGRAASPSTQINQATLASASKRDPEAFPDLAATPLKEQVKILPPIAKFLELETAGDLKINEVLELLRDYRRLAGVLKDLGVV